MGKVDLDTTNAESLCVDRRADDTLRRGVHERDSQ